MRNTILATLTILLWMACGNNPKGEPDMLALFNDNPTEETYSQAIKEQMTIIRNPEASEAEKITAMERGYEASQKMNKVNESIGFLNTLIKEDFDSPATPQRLLDLSLLLQKSGNDALSQTIAQGFILSFPKDKKLDQAKSLVPEGAPTIEERIMKLGNEMFDMDAGKLRQNVARNFVDLCEAYAMSAPKQADVPVYLSKAAETARTMRTLPKAISLYDWVLEKYPDNEKAPQALFLKAFTFDNNLNDFDNAKKYYEEFLEKYPDNEFADDTEFLLENLGKSDEEMLETLTKKEKKK